MTKIYHLQFKEPINGKTNYYFGSLSAIYETLDAENIGCTIAHLWNIGIAENNPFTNDKCIISKEILIRKKTNRGILKNK